MLQPLIRRSRRILMTVDAVGGVWRYALDLARELAQGGDSIVLAGLGPEPSEEQVKEAQAFAALAWLKTPPDWTTRNEDDLDRLPQELGPLVRDYAIDLVHLNAPTQAVGLDVPCPIVAVSHSCVVTWLRAVRGQAVDGEWGWQKGRNRRGFDWANAVIAPSRSHADMLEACYGPIARLSVVSNGTRPGPKAQRREAVVLAAARWWDEGKNAATLDQAAALTKWPVFAAGPLRGADGQRADFSNVVPLGSVCHDEVRLLMARAGIFVSPSVYEPFGLAVLEAATSSTPLVLADITTYRELWDGAAMFYQVHDPRDLARCIDRLSCDAELRRRLGEAAARQARKFSAARQAAAMRDIYDRAALAVAER